MKTAARPMITMNKRLMKNTGRISFSSRVPLTAAKIKRSPKTAVILLQTLFSNILKEERMMNAQLYKSNIPADVVMYS